MSLVKLRLASGVDVYINPDYVVSLWPVLDEDDNQVHLVMRDGSSTYVRGRPSEVALKLVAG